MSAFDPLQTLVARLQLADDALVGLEYTAATCLVGGNGRDRRDPVAFARLGAE